MIDRVGAQGAQSAHSVPEHRHHGGPRRAPREGAPVEGRPSPDAADSGVSAVAGGFREQTSASFTFVTADGDTVTLQSSQTRELAFAGYNAQGQSGAVATASQSSSFSLSVEGELDAEELQDIRKAMQFLKRAGQDGQIDAKELSTFANRQDVDSLKSISGSLETTRSEIAISAYA